jgi:lipopolysaccharide cholinephosphotransferase
MKLATQGELRQIQLRLLDAVDVFCKKNNINYMLASGTLIGAIRHKGFIPWDDDVDVYMPRPDYNKFVAGFNSDGGSYEVVSFDLDHKFLYPYAKVFDTDTVLIERNAINYNLGINIDIFPIDGIEDDDTALVRRQVFLGRVYSVKVVSFSRNRAMHRNALLCALKCLFCWLPTEWVVGRIIANAKKYEYGAQKSVCVLSEGLANNRILRKEIFSNTVEGEFEGNVYQIPAGYDEYLKATYGDYMRLPPEEDRVSHHAFDAYLKDANITAQYEMMNCGR